MQNLPSIHVLIHQARQRREALAHTAKTIRRTMMIAICLISIAIGAGGVIVVEHVRRGELQILEREIAVVLAEANSKVDIGELKRRLALSPSAVALAAQLDGLPRGSIWSVDWLWNSNDPTLGPDETLVALASKLSGMSRQQVSDALGLLSIYARTAEPGKRIFEALLQIEEREFGRVAEALPTFLKSPVARELIKSFAENGGSEIHRCTKRTKQRGGA